MHRAVGEVADQGFEQLSNRRVGRHSNAGRTRLAYCTPNSCRSLPPTTACETASLFLFSGLSPFVMVNPARICHPSRALGTNAMGLCRDYRLQPRAPYGRQRAAVGPCVCELYRADVASDQEQQSPRSYPFLFHMHCFYRMPTPRVVAHDGCTPVWLLEQSWRFAASRRWRTTLLRPGGTSARS